MMRYPNESTSGKGSPIPKARYEQTPHGRIQMASLDVVDCPQQVAEWGPKWTAMGEEG
jgi:hypothetical protein